MANNLYELFGLDESCSDEQLDEAYGKIRSKYAEDRFLEGEAGNEAAKKLTEIDNAYRDIVALRRENSRSDSGASDAFKSIEEKIKSGDLAGAQNDLDSFNERNAEWHYLQSVVFYKKKWSNESKKQLEIAMQMDPANEKYKTAYNKLTEKIKSDSNKNFTSYSGNKGYGRNTSGDSGAPQMGGDTCLDWCCQMAICNIALNCCCNSCH